jgi:hypothetical protein
MVGIVVHGNNHFILSGPTNRGVYCLARATYEIG